MFSFPQFYPPELSTKHSPKIHHQVVAVTTKVHFRVRKRPPLVPILGEINPAYFFSIYFFKIRINIILPSKLRSSKWSLRFLHAFLFSTICSTVLISYHDYRTVLHAAETTGEMQLLKTKMNISNHTTLSLRNFCVSYIQPDSSKQRSEDLHIILVSFFCIKTNCFYFSLSHTHTQSRSLWPCGLRRRSEVARLLRLWVRNSAGGMEVCCECFVLSGRVLCDELIIGPEESYRL